MKVWSEYGIIVLIGASLSEPHINGTSMRAVFIFLWYDRHPRAAS